jgi:hypothetical protein
MQVHKELRGEMANEMLNEDLKKRMERIDLLSKGEQEELIQKIDAY